MFHSYSSHQTSSLHILIIYSYIAPIPQFEYSRSNNPFRPFIDDTRHFKHVGIPGPSPSECRAKYTGVPANRQNKSQRTRNKQQQQQRNQRSPNASTSTLYSDSEFNISQNVVMTPPQQQRRTTSTRAAKTQAISLLHNQQQPQPRPESQQAEWNEMSYDQQKEIYLVCFIFILI